MRTPQEEAQNIIADNVLPFTTGIELAQSYADCFKDATAKLDAAKPMEQEHWQEVLDCLRKLINHV